MISHRERKRNRLLLLAFPLTLLAGACSALAAQPDRSPDAHPAQTLRSAAWSVKAAGGEVREITWQGKTVCTLVGGTRIAEMKKIDPLRKVARFLKKGTWRGQKYAMWEGRLDDGEHYVLDYGQVVQVGDRVIWTTHVSWLPPVLLRVAHLQVDIDLSSDMVRSVEAAGVRTDPTKIGMGIEIKVGDEILLRGTHGRFRLRVFGFGRDMLLMPVDGGLRLRLTEEDYYGAYGEMTAREAADWSDRWASKWIHDLKPHRMSVVLERVEGQM